MDENQITPKTGYQQNQPWQDNLTDNQTLPGNNQEEDLENRDRNSRKEFSERTQQHDYKNPSANQIEDDEEDEVDTDGVIYNQDDPNDTEPVDEQSPDVTNLNPVRN